jgi:hypothetical protein
MTFFFIPWRPVISRFAQNAAHHSCSSVFKASVGCPIFPRLAAQTVDARKPLPTTTTGLRIAKKAAGSGLDQLSPIPDIQEAIVARLRNRAIEPQVVVSLNQQHSSVVSVLGDVNAPGVLALNSVGERLLALIARAGGSKFEAIESYVTL